LALHPAATQGSLAQPRLSVLILLALPVQASAPVVDTQSHEENRPTDTPTEQQDEYKDLATSQISHFPSIQLCSAHPGDGASAFTSLHHPSFPMAMPM